jgi:hypothetical protein
MTDEELEDIQRKVQFVGGQVHMLVGFALAIIESHPDLRELERKFQMHAQTTLANTEAITVPEEYVDGVLDISKRLQTAIERVRERREGPKDRNRT